MRINYKRIAMFSAAALAAGVFAAPASTMNVQAAAKVRSSAAYSTQWTTTYPTVTLLKSALLNTQTNADGIYEQLMLAIKYRTVDEYDIMQLVNEGIQIPVSSVQRLYNEGWISGYLYKALTGQAVTASDFKDVFNATYYMTANPVILSAVQSGALPADEETLFQNWLACGLPAGLSGNGTYSKAWFEQTYPAIAKALGNDALLEVQYYILHQNSLIKAAVK